MNTRIQNTPLRGGSVRCVEFNTERVWIYHGIRVLAGIYI